MLKKLALMVVAVAVLLVGGTYIAFRVSPWPSVLLIRWAFADNGEKALKALEKYVPQGISEKRNLRYAEGSPDTLLDIFSPPGIEDGARLPVVVWVHGGGFIGGTKDHVANYLKILAGQGFVTVSIDYSLAPGAQYPTPVRQLNEALAFIAANAGAYHVDTARFILGGDSAGAQIAAQTAIAISKPAYAKELALAPAIMRSQLRGVVLHSGAYAADGLNFDGEFGRFLRTVFWAYLGTRDFDGDPRLKQLSVIANADAGFPPAFITSGNADPLEPQARRLAEKLKSVGVTADTLFFEKSYQPPLEHEYQFNLDIKAGRQAFERSVAFMKSVP
ncbi:MAG: alpha/beta hydrolase [Parvibaculaceae bacterium]